jgi:hypothetical protein
MLCISKIHFTLAPVFTKKTEIMTPTELSKAVKETLMDKPNKAVIFKSFALSMGDQFQPFMFYCEKQIDVIKKQSIDRIKKEIEEKQKLLKELEGK